ncbi:MAG: MBOAT family protein [Mollicutes bacterium]|nr:MBOAT family protein [Mollicutes bacterium]
MVINFILLILSLLIYASLGITNLLFILFSILTSFFAAKLFKSKNKKFIFIITIILNSLVFFFFKFMIFKEITSFNLIVPLGISYYTLQIISYLIDVYKNKYPAEKSLWKYMLSVAYLPHLFIGPIAKYDEIKDAIFNNRKTNWSNFYLGITRVFWGLSKKLIISGRIAIITNNITTNNYSGWYILLAVFLYSIQLYADFSGGIDVVLGLSKILGIDLKENFNSPFDSQSVKEFWRRWHISLGRWLKEYIYIPLGGNKHGTFRKNINLLITFFISGLWHGLSYLLWGIFHGIFVMFGEKLKTPFQIVNKIGTFILISLLWCFFLWSDPFIALKMIGSIITDFNLMNVIQNIFNLGLALSDWIVLIIFTTTLFIIDKKQLLIKDKLLKIAIEFKLIILGIMILFILLFGIYGIGFNVNEFIYSNF